MSKAELFAEMNVPLPAKDHSDNESVPGEDKLEKETTAGENKEEQVETVKPPKKKRKTKKSGANKENRPAVKDKLVS